MAIIRNGYLWTCQHVGLNSADGTYSGDQTGSSVNRSGIQWWKLQLNSTGTPLTYSASGIVYDRATSNPWWYYMPSLAVNWQNAMPLGFSGSSTTNYISAFRAGRTADGTLLGNPIVIQMGTAYYTNDVRWGDYSYTTVDPADNQTFWTIQSFATNNFPAPGWSDWLMSVKPGP